VNVAIRADASEVMGSGHVMRCLALADELAASGNAVQFASRTLRGNMIDLVERRGFSVAPLPAADDVPYPEWHGAWQDDAAATAAAIARSEAPIEWLITDCYALGSEWQRALRPHARRIMVIDDLANRAHDCDLLLDQNLCAGPESRYATLVPRDCLRLEGPRYALLRREFGARRAQLPARDGVIRRILICFGGTDTGNVTLKALRAIGALGRRILAVDVVLGPGNPHAESVRLAAEALPQARLVPPSESMVGLMAAADLAVGASGGMAWERCCLGLPSIVVALSANQQPNARALAKAGCAVTVDNDETTQAGIGEALGRLLEDPESMREMARAAAGVTDGEGARRVARMLEPAAVSVRPARASDCEQVYQWRNAEQTRLHSHDPAPISASTHTAWFEAALRSERRRLLIGECDGRPVGVLRYDLQEPECTVSVYLVPGSEGRGFGPRLLQAGHLWLREHCSRIEAVRAEVLPANKASISAFRAAGYAPSSAGSLKRVL
jgi:UDP-2,4-diacetamido-2,4,6-trideoxy-beta-L-altropyranose hydrolase